MYNFKQTFYNIHMMELQFEPYVYVIITVFLSSSVLLSFVIFKQIVVLSYFWGRYHEDEVDLPGHL